MEKRPLGLIISLIVMGVCGCATLTVEKATSVAIQAKVENFSFDLSTPGTDTGTLIVQFRQPSNQLFVEKYAIKVDSNSALVVSKQCDVNIKLNAGKHSLKLYATTAKEGGSENVTFGKASTKEIMITKDTVLTMKYTGPYRLLGEGKVEIKQ